MPARVGPSSGTRAGWLGRREGREGFGSALTSLAWRAVLAVLGSIALDDLPGAVVTPDGEGQAQHMVAGLDDPQDAAHPVPLLFLALPGLEIFHQLVLHNAGAAVEEALHHLEEVGVVLEVCGPAVVSPSRRRRPGQSDCSCRGQHRGAGRQWHFAQAAARRGQEGAPGERPPRGRPSFKLPPFVAALSPLAAGHLTRKSRVRHSDAREWQGGTGPWCVRN